MARCKVIFEPMHATVEVDPANPPAAGEGKPGSLLDVALANGVSIEHACGGVGACGTCHVIVEQGSDNLSEPGDDELDTVESAPGSTPDSRLACLAIVRGDVTVRVPEWKRNLVSEGP